jgi:hypothetical protein
MISPSSLACTVMELCSYIENNYKDTGGEKIGARELKNLTDVVKTVQSPQVQLLIHHSPRTVQMGIFEAVKDLPIAYEIADFTKRQNTARVGSKK